MSVRLHKRVIHMKIKFIAYIVANLAYMIACNSQDTNELPSWAVGAWAGDIGYEHDTISCQVLIDIRESLNTDSMYLVVDGTTFQLMLDSTSGELVRFHIQDLKNGTNMMFNNGTIDLVNVDYYPSDLIHAQFYPNNSEELWIGQLEKIEDGP